MSKAVKPRSTFFERSARSTRMIRCSRRRAQHLAPRARRPPRDAAARSQPLGVDRERVGADPGLAAVVEDRAALEVDVELHQLAAAAEEVAAVGAGVEADDVVGEHARGRSPRGSGRAGSASCRAGTRGCGRSGGGRRRARSSRIMPGAGVEVVVVEHHQRLAPGPRSALEHRRGDVVVDRPCSRVPGVELLLADVGRVGEVPEVVLDEPEDRVGDHVVEAVVGARVAADQADLGSRSPSSSTSTGPPSPPRRRRRPRRSSPRRSRARRGARRGRRARSPGRRRRAARSRSPRLVALELRRARGWRR